MNLDALIIPIKADNSQVSQAMDAVESKASRLVSSVSKIAGGAIVGGFAALSSADIRLLRMLRVFRILKVTAYMTEYATLGGAIWASRRRIAIFIGTVFMIVVLMGTLMYVSKGARTDSPAFRCPCTGQSPP